MHISRRMGIALSGLAMLLSAGCTQDLNVTNPNNPDIARALANPGDVQSLAVSSVNAWYIGSNQVDPWAMLDVTADVVTMNYGNFGARFDNLEPRTPYSNKTADGLDLEAAKVPWQSWYASLGEANDVLRALKGGMELPDGTDKYKALALFSQAASLMQLSLVYDQAYAVDENSDLAAVKLQPYNEVADSALSKLDALISLTAGQNWVYSKDEFPVTGGFTAQKLNQLANTMAAQLIEYTPRNAAQAATANYAKALQYANNGITGDFAVDGDGSTWWSDIVGLFNTESWTMVDTRLICQMAPAIPCRYDPADSGGVAAYALTGAHDARVQIDHSWTDTSGADFIYDDGTVIGDPGRGIYMQSPYFYQREWDLEWYSNDYSLGSMVYTRKAENDLLIAEALVRTGGDKALAATLVNNTRVGRGQLTPLTAASTDQEFYDAITYEREVELYATNGYSFMYMRHDDKLQPGTVRHLPVPASELETVGLPVYTFGGAVENPTGMNAYVAGLRPLSNMTLGSRPGPRQSVSLPDGTMLSLAGPVSLRNMKGARIR